jgi:PEP-CTERM motif
MRFIGIRSVLGSLHVSIAATAFAALCASVAPSPANASVTPESCTYNTGTAIGCGGATSSVATPLTAATNSLSLNGFSGSQWYEFGWGGGDITIGATINSLDSNYTLALETISQSLVGSDSFSDGSASLSESSLAAGNYLVGLSYSGGPDPNGSLTFSPDADPPLPEPGSLILLGSGLVGLAGLRRRRRLRADSARL